MNDAFIQSIHQLKAKLGANRLKACETALALNLPSIKDEWWKDTELRFFTHHPLEIEHDTSFNTHAIMPFTKNLGHTFIFVNGRFAPEFSQYDSSGIEIHHFNHPPTPFAADFFTELNTAFAPDFVHMVIKKSIEEPIFIYFITDQKRNQTAFSRFHVIAKPNIKATILESHMNLSPLASAVNSITTYEFLSHSTIELGVMHDAKLSHQLHRAHATLHDGVQLQTFSAYHSGQEIRHHFTGEFKGQHARLHYKSLNVLSQRQRLSLLLDLHHTTPTNESDQAVRNLVFDNARSAFTGSIAVHKEAKDSKAWMLNKNLLLSPQAQSLSRPLLTIDTDAVECSHGSSTGFLDHNALFYLQARGIEEAEAKTMLAQAFAEELLTDIESPVIRALGEKAIQSLTQHFKRQ